MNSESVPLEPDELDELLSADLDDELEAAASERGSDVETLRARIAATPDAAERRAALATAREMLAARPELPELDASRLRANAVRAAESAVPARLEARADRRNRALVAMAGIAACVLVVAGIAFATSRSNSSSSSDRSASAATPNQPKIDVTPPVPSLGSYSDVQSLGSVALNAAQQRAAAGLGASAAHAGNAQGVASSAGVPAETAPAFRGLEPSKAPANTQDVTGSGSGDSENLRYGAPRRTTSKSAAKASAACSPAKFAGQGDELLMQATATLTGRPVRVYVFAGDAGHTVVVLDGNCALVTVQSGP